MTEEAKTESLELPLGGGGAGVIFYIKSTGQFMFFLRDKKDSIPFPDKIDIIGGHMDPGETPEETAMRELREELEDIKSGKPWYPEKVTLFRQWIDSLGVQQNIFGCELEEAPDIRTNEGQGLVFLNREDLTTTDFAFGFQEVVLAYAATV